MLVQLGHPDAQAVLERWATDARVDAEAAVQCDMDLAQMAQTNNDAPAAMRYALRAQQRALTSTHITPIKLADVESELGYGYSLNDQLDAADQHFAAAIRKYRELGQGESPAVVAIFNNWAVVARRAGDYQHALAMLDEIVRIDGGRGAGGEPPPYVLTNRARALVALGRYDEGIAEADRAIRSMARTDDTSKVIHPLSVKIDASIERGDFAAAQLLLAEAEHRVRELPAGVFDAGTLAYARGRMALLQGRPAQAHSIAQSLVAKSSAVANHSGNLMAALRLRAAAALQLGDAVAARRDAVQALQIAQRLQGARPRSLATAQSWLLLARAAAAVGDRSAARANASKALAQFRQTLAPNHPDVAAAQQLGL